MSQKVHWERLELNKILSFAAGYAATDGAKEAVCSLAPSPDISVVRRNLKITAEAKAILFEYGLSRIEYYSPFTDELTRSAKGAVLSCGELLNCAALMRSARTCYKSIASAGEDVVLLKEISSRLYFDERLEDDIFTKIINDSEVSDYASDKLYSIRSEIRTLNERIRLKLQEYLVSESSYLQDSIITMRDERYVLPVKAEYKRSVNGLIHDKSQSGSTVYIEPEYILEMNNELKSLQIDEREEVERILGELSRRVGFAADRYKEDISILTEIDSYYARAEYSYKNKCVKPEINGEGRVKIIKGRHPLIDAKKVVPVSVELGGKYSFLLLSGPNTGGKTVTLKMTGLFCLMAACGLFIPAAEGSEISVFKNVFCDVGDAQSIEDNLSTFSSHITNIINIVNSVDERSLVLVDELGGGTDPEEGQAIAKAVTEYLLKSGAKGIITTHFTSLKEYAYSLDGVENASMEFDAATLQPLYNVKLGMPGSSNAIAISRSLGLNEDILSSAMSFMNDGAKAFENIVRTAEETRLSASRALAEAEALKSEWAEKIKILDAEREKLEKEKEKLFLNAKAESRRIINERTEEAEELLKEMQDVFDKEELTQNDLIRARTLKNKLADKAYESEKEGYIKPQYAPFGDEKIKVGDRVFIQSFNGEGEVLSLNEKRRQAEVRAGSLTLRVKYSDLLKVISPVSAAKKKEKAPTKRDNVNVIKNLNRDKIPSREINLLGLASDEAITEVENFISSAVVAGFEEVKIVHGFGTGKLKAAVHAYLKKCKAVKEFRLGKYGEGEGGVTIVTLK